MQALQMIRPSAGCSASGTQSSFPSAQAPGRLRGRKSENPKGRGTQELKASREIVGRDEGLEERCRPQKALKDLEQRPQSRAGESSLSYSRTPSYLRDGRGWPQPHQATTVVIFSWIQFYLVWLGAGVGGPCTEGFRVAISTGSSYVKCVISHLKATLGNNPERCYS